MDDLLFDLPELQTNFFIFLFLLSNILNRALKGGLDHGQCALDEVAEVVGQIRIDPMDKSFMGEIPIQADGNFSKQKITQRVGSKGV